MYATAHRVASSRNGRQGINAFLHTHGRDFPWPQDASSLPELNPGRLEDEIIGIKPGGNNVRAYLDILAPDTIALEELFSALNNFAKSIPTLDNPLATHESIVTIRFGVESELEKERSEQFQVLIAAIRPLLEASMNSWQRGETTNERHER
jgi:hypothetical protein